MSLRHDILERHGARLLRYARALAGEAEAARDLWQETAARFLAARRVPGEETEARLYLFRCLRNAAIDRVRHERIVADHAAAQAALAPPPADPSALIAEITVRQALARLTPEQREMVALVDMSGLSYAEAASVAGVPVGTVMSRLSRARAAMLADIGGMRVVPLRRAAG